MSETSSCSSSCSRSSGASDTDATSILEAHHVDEVSADVFDKVFYGFTVADTRGRPFELNQRLSTAVSELGGAKDLVASACNVLNRVMHLYESSCSPRGATRVKFVEHSQAALVHHPERSSGAPTKPHLIAVLDPIASSYSRDVRARSKRRARADPPAIAWHHVLAGILINDGYDERQPLDQMVDFLGVLNQARPDLAGCFSISATREACRVWWSDAAGIYATPRLTWDDPATATRLLNFVYRLHHPLAADSTISLESMAQGSVYYDQKPVWHVGDGLGGVYRIQHTIAVGAPWTRKNWVAASTEHRSGDERPFTPCSRVIVKDSFPMIDSEAFVEDAILDHLHEAGAIPGICSPISAFLVANGDDHVRSVQVPDSDVSPRRKHRLVMRGDGQDIYQCPSVLRFIMTMYDVLEVLRYAHEHRGVLHRDISLRNILHSSPAARRPHPGCKFASDILAHKYPQMRNLSGSACILIDFDNAVLEGCSPESALRESVGTSAFVARNVSKRFKIAGSSPLRPIPQLIGSAKECYLEEFGHQIYDARSQLLAAAKLSHDPAPAERAVHRPHHDAESCFWLISHFLLTALPKGANRANDPTRANRILAMLENNQLGDFLDPRRQVLELNADDWATFLHPGLKSLGKFVYSLANVVRPCFDLFEPPPPPYHLHEAMQRVLLQEACRLLDSSPLPLDTQCRRSFHSHFHDLPTALKCQPTVTSRKRSAEGLDDREGSASRPRLIGRIGHNVQAM